MATSSQQRTRPDTSGADPARELRRFHLGEPGGGLRGLEPDHPYLPLHLDRYREAGPVRAELPLFLCAPDGDAHDDTDELWMELPDLLAELTEAAEPAGKGLLEDNLRRLEGHVHRFAADADGPVAAEDLLRRAGDAMLAELSLGEEDTAALTAGLEALLERVPEGGRLAPFRRRLPLDLMRQALAARGASSRRGALSDVRSLRSEVEGLLAADDRRRGGGDPDALAGSLGKLGSRMLRSDSLSGIVDRRAGGAPLAEGLRRRLEQALETLESLDGEAPQPVLCVTDGALPDLFGVDELPGWRVVVSDDPCREAGERFEAAAEEMARVARARKLVRLAAEGRYEPARHDDWLERLDWQGLSAAELALAPPVVALLSAEEVVGEGLPSLSSLLLSGRPVQVVVLVRPGSMLSALPDTLAVRGEEPLGGYRFEPAYHGLGHREAYVAQTSPARPLHLADTFRRAAGGTRTALHVVAEVPDTDKPPGPYLRAAAALEGRAHALFRYDPEAGATWARRLDFSDNPGPDLPWPDDDEAGAFTFAHFALTEPGYGHHFAPLPDGVDDDALAPLAEWLDLSGEERAGVVPTVEAVDGGGGRARLAVSRRLALATVDRQAYWRTLQELAGVHSEYADRAAAEAREEVEARTRSQVEELEARHAAELERVRTTAVREAAERITCALLDVDPALFDAARSPFERFAGRDAGEVSRELLDALGDVGAADGAAEPAGDGTNAGGTSADSDRLAAQLLELVAGGLDDDEPNTSDTSNTSNTSNGDASSPDDGRREPDQS